MNLEQWISLSGAARNVERENWNVYGEGYWHTLNQIVSSRFREHLGATPHILEVMGGTYHGGELIIGVRTDLPYPEVIDLPKEYLGFRVLQFCGGNIPAKTQL